MHSYDKPFFVYFTWRFDYGLQTLESKLKKWWASQDDNEFEKERSLSHIFVHPLSTVDLPIVT